jgi:hypothetical protein
VNGGKKQVKPLNFAGARGLIFMICLAAAVCLAQQSKSNSDQPAPSSPAFQLSLTIKADRQSYRMKDAMRLETQLTNTGTQIFYLFDDVCWNPANFLTIYLFSISGKEVHGHSGFLRDCLPPPPLRDDTSRFLKLEPGAFQRDTEKFDVRELVPGPGEYIIVVHYKGALSQEWISEYGGDKMKALPIWTRERPTLRSNEFHVTIRQ